MTHKSPEEFLAEIQAKFLKDLESKKVSDEEIRSKVRNSLKSLGLGEKAQNSVLEDASKAPQEQSETTQEILRLIRQNCNYRNRESN